jgi:hypothetical protein
MLGLPTSVREWFGISSILYSISLFHLRLYHCYYVYVNIKLYIIYIHESNVYYLF